MDAEKAFDCVEFPYLYAVLEKFGLGTRFISWIKLLYSNPTARVLTNQTMSETINLHRGTRQGCPLSPLLFALALEPLAETIRTNKEIHGYDTDYTTNKISLYADDILTFITEPQTSMPVLLETIDLFSSFSGYRVNWTKSELMPVRCSDPGALEQTPFRLAQEKFTYLGLEITKKYSKLFDANYMAILNKFKNKLEFWKTLPISLIGRVNAVKMVCLPQLLYLFQNLPIFLSKTYFKKLDSMILSFIWNYKTHRIRKGHLCKSKTNGGLALPDFVRYYWAANIRCISYWLDETVLLASWLDIEREDCFPYSIGAIVMSPIHLKKSYYSYNPIIHSTIQIWRQISKQLKLRKLSFTLPIAANPSFTPSIINGGFDRWKEFGLYSVGDLYIGGSFASFQQLQENYGLSKSDFFRYLQARHFVRTHLDHFENATPDKLDRCLRDCTTERNAVSAIYDSLQELDQVNTAYIKEGWEKELGMTIAEDIWKGSLRYINTCSLNARHCLIQFKTLHRLHYSRVKLHRIFPEISPICEKCNQEEANLLHSYTLCPKLEHFWTAVFSFFSKVFKTTLQPDPLLVILGTSGNIGNLQITQRRLLSYGLLCGKKLVLLHWKKTETPTFKEWLTALTDTLHLERIRYSLSGRLEDFKKIWQPIISFLNQDVGQPE